MLSHAQFEDDTLGNIQPVKVMVEDVTHSLTRAAEVSGGANAVYPTYRTVLTRGNLV